jgi:hypothetical protein
MSGPSSGAPGSLSRGKAGRIWGAGVFGLPGREGVRHGRGGQSGREGNGGLGGSQAVRPGR